MKVLLAEDHPVVRERVRAMLAGERDLEVVGRPDGSKVLALDEELHRDVVVLDLIMPGMGGLEVLQELPRHCPGTRVVILSIYSNEAHILEALRRGAGGYVLKQSAGQELVRGIREVAAGRSYLSPAPVVEWCGGLRSAEARGCTEGWSLIAEGLRLPGAFLRTVGHPSTDAGQGIADQHVDDPGTAELRLQ